MQKIDIFIAGFVSGIFVSMIAVFLYSLSRLTNNYKTLLGHLGTTIAYNKGIVSVADLTIKAGISPVKAANFLQKLTRQLGIEPEVAENGAIYYRFVKSKDLQ